MDDCRITKGWEKELWGHHMKWTTEKVLQTTPNKLTIGTNLY